MKKGSKQHGRVGGLKPQKQLTLRDLHQEFIMDCKVRGLSAQTITSYTNQYKYFTNFLHDETAVRETTEQTVKEYIVHLMDRGITKSTTINSYLQDLSPMLKYAIRKGYILRNIDIPFVHGQTTLKEIYSQEELKALLEKPVSEDFLSLRVYAIVWVLASTGVRARELRNLKNENVDFINRVITLNETKNKSPRQVPISKALYHVLMGYMAVRGGEGQEYLFPTIYNEMMAMTSLQTAVKGYCNSKGVYKTSLHLFRHTFITNAVNQGVSPLILQRITGHQTMAQLNRYYNSRVEDIVEVIDQIAPATNNRKRLL